MASSFLRGRRAPGGENWPLWALCVASIGLLSLSFDDLFQGFIPGLDDMMRLQQVRDLLNGQSWFDVNQSRLLTPEGGEMHWSRLPDLFVAGFILLTRPFIGQPFAETLAIGIWPLILLAIAFSFLCAIMRRLGLSRASQFAGLLFFASSAAIFNFWPGRIDHHGLVVVLILGGFAALLSVQKSARSGIVLAICLTAALSVAIEGLPYIAGLIAILGLFWVVRGHLEGVRLAAFGMALTICSSIFFVADAPGVGPQRVVCDAYGTGHWAGLTVGGSLLVALGVFGGALDTWQKRMIVGLSAGAVTLAVMYFVNPACLGDPYAAVPESVRASWLNGVAEAKSVSQVLATEPDRFVWVFGFLSVASIASVLMITQSPPEYRLARTAFMLLLGLSILATIWQVRGQSFSHLFGSVSAGWLAGSLFNRWRDRGGIKPLSVFALSAIAAFPLTWQNLGMIAGPNLQAPGMPESVSQKCIEPENFAELLNEDPMNIHTPIDLGVSVLMRTQHKIFVGPYHRNVEGIERANMVLIGDQSLAQQRLLEMGATHLAYCVGLGETNRYATLWPESLAASLNRNEVPDWLEPADEKSEIRGVVRLYRIRSR